MKKFTAVILSILMAVSVFTACGKKNDENKKNEEQQNEQIQKYDDVKLDSGIIATVNDEQITVGEIEFYLAQYCESIYSQNGLAQATAEEKQSFWDKEENGVKIKDSFYDNALDGYIGLVSMVNLAKEKGIDVTDEEVDAELAQEGIDTAIEHYSTTYGVTRESIASYMKRQMIYEKYATEYIEKDERMNISDEAVKDYFSENYIKAQHILKMTIDQETNAPFSDEDKKKAYESAQAVLEKVKADGADFKAIMLEESEDPGSKSEPDGYVFKEGDMVTEFYETAKALKDNEISDIVETSYGYHIIKRLPLDLEKDLEDNKDNITSALKTKVFQEILKESKEKMNVKADYTQLYAIEGILY